MKTPEQNKQPTLTEEEFESLITNIMDKFAGKSLKVAKLMWVDGLSAIEAGKAHGMSKQSAHSLGIRLERARAGAPAGWVPLNLYVPPELAREVKERVKEFRADIAHAAELKVEGEDA